jgi:CHAT domain-containing protein
MQLTGQLAVLSACNTGGGKLERGEGIISLARGFFYAGIPSVVMTLWEIEDHSSADLMGLFYKNLKAGYPNDIALQMAKVSYLEKAGKLLSHPYFWAGYVNIGKTDPIRFGSGWQLKNTIYLGIATLLLILLTFLFINRRVFLRKNRY